MDQLIVETVPAVIDTNFEALHAQLQAEVAKYDIVVTSDTVAEAKRLAAALNKLKAEIARRRKEEVAKASEPVRDFEAKVKLLEGLCEDGRQRIVVQVEQFEAATLKLVRSALAAYLDMAYFGKAVSEEFQTVTLDDLVKLGSITGTGRLTGATAAIVDARVLECQLRQQMVALRLSELENRSYRAGLHAPLTREHIAGFLFESVPDKYDFLLDALIASEKDRQAETIAKAEAAADRNRVSIDTPESIKTDVPPWDQPGLQAAYERKPDPAPELDDFIQADYGDGPAPSGPYWVQVTISLHVRPPRGTPLEKIDARLRAKLAAAGVEDSIQSINYVEYNG